MIISEHSRVVFFHIPKTAGIAIRYFMLEHLGGFILTRSQRDIQVGGLPEKYREFFKFTVVRNPYDRLWGWYRYLCREPKHNLHSFACGHSFSEYIEHLAKPPEGMQQAELAGGFQFDFIQKMGPLNAILRFENLEQEFHALSFVPDDVRLSKANHYPAKITWQEAYDFDSAMRTQEVYRKDFLELDYSSSHPYLVEAVND